MKIALVGSFYVCLSLLSCRQTEAYTEEALLPAQEMQVSKDLLDTAVHEMRASTLLQNQVHDSLPAKPLPSKQNKKVPVPDEHLLTETVQNNDDHYLIPGYIKSIFIENGNQVEFKYLVKYQEDRRIGCSGGGEEWSFTISNPSDTFLIENELLKSIDFTYAIQGGLYSEQGEHPYKGKIKGMLLSDKTWQLELDLWIKMKDMLQNEVEQHLQVNQRFHP